MVLCAHGKGGYVDTLFDGVFKKKHLQGWGFSSALQGPELNHRHQNKKRKTVHSETQGHGMWTSHVTQEHDLHSVAGVLSLLWPQVPLRHPGMCGLGCRSRPRRPQLPRCFLSCHHAEGEGSSPARGLGTSNSDQMQQISRLCSFCIEKATTLIVFISVSLNENKLHFGNTIFVFLDTGSHY